MDFVIRARIPVLVDHFLEVVVLTSDLVLANCIAVNCMSKIGEPHLTTNFDFGPNTLGHPYKINSNRQKNFSILSKNLVL